MKYLTATIKQVQSALGVTSDGIAGPVTWSAIRKHIVTNLIAEVDTNLTEVPKVDERSEKYIRTLHEQAQPYARALVHEAKKQGITIKIISGTRTYAEQNTLYAQGRSQPGKRVTNARGGYSNHNFGIAFDACIFDGSRPVWESPHYQTLGTIGKELGLEWGGDWRTFKDKPHFQLRPTWAKNMREKDMLRELRYLTFQKKDIFANG